MDKFLKILDFVLVIAAIVLAVYVGKNIGLEYLMRGREEPVTLSMTEAAFLRITSAGLPAGISPSLRTDIAGRKPGQLTI